MKESVLLLAEDNPADQVLARRSLNESNKKTRLCVVEDGMELMDYLYKKGKYTCLESSPRPDMIILDINMPGMNGKEALKRIKSDPDFKKIPVVMLSTSTYEKDITESYLLGANAYTVKPFDVDQYMQLIIHIENYWLTW